jgi:hypothetical protein
MPRLISLRLLMEDDMGGNVSWVGEITNVYKITFIKLE